MSQHKTIIDAVKTAIEALTGEPTVVIRDRIVKFEEDTLPIVVLTMGKEQRIGDYFGGTYRGYEVFVGIFYAQNQQVQTSIDDAKPWRDTIRKALIPDETSAPPILSGVSAVWDCDEIDTPAAGPAASEANYEEARLGLLYKTSEARHA